MVNYARASSQSESGKYFEWIIIVIIINFTEKYIELKRSIQHQKNLLPFCFPFAGGRMELSCGRFSQLVIDYELITVTLAQFLVEEVYSLVNIIKMFRFFFYYRWLAVPPLQGPRSGVFAWKGVSNAAAGPYLWRTVSFTILIVAIVIVIVAVTINVFVIVYYYYYYYFYCFH